MVILLSELLQYHNCKQIFFQSGVDEKLLCLALTRQHRLRIFFKLVAERTSEAGQLDYYSFMSFVSSPLALQRRACAAISMFLCFDQVQSEAACRAYCNAAARTTEQRQNDNCKSHRKKTSWCVRRRVFVLKFEREIEKNCQQLTKEIERQSFGIFSDFIQVFFVVCEYLNIVFCLLCAQNLFFSYQQRINSDCFLYCFYQQCYFFSSNQQ